LLDSLLQEIYKKNEQAGNALPKFPCHGDPGLE